MIIKYAIFRSLISLSKLKLRYLAKPRFDLVIVIYEQNIIAFCLIKLILKPVLIN